MTREKKEFPKGQFSGFWCVLEYFETLCVFSPWLDSLFIVVEVDFGLILKIFLFIFFGFVLLLIVS